MRTSFYVPDDLAAEALRHGISLSAVVRHALQRAVREAEITAEPAVHDDTRFIASMLLKSLSAEQVIALIDILANGQE